MAEGARSATEADWTEARKRAWLIEAWADAQASGLSENQAAAYIGSSAGHLRRLRTRYCGGGLAGLLPERGRAGRPAEFRLPDWFIHAARFFYLLSNRTADSGSLPEAVRRVISLPICPPHLVARLAKVLNQHGVWPPTNGSRISDLKSEILPTCPPALRDTILARERAGQSLLPERIARQIRASRAAVRAFRNPREFRLDHLTTTGVQRMARNAAGDLEGFLRAGDVIEPDDGTINFAVAVPWDLPGNRCADRHGHIVGRFQLFLMVDAGTGYIPSFVYVIRPRGSYRSEDVLWSYEHFARAHGFPRCIRHEGGAWAAERVLDCLRLSGVKAQRARGPRGKPFVEGTFSVVWTKLSITCPGQVGRYQGETEGEIALIESCRSGAHSPTEFFPLLSDALEAVTEAVSEKNRTLLRTDFGSWVPEERWAEQLEERPLRAWHEDLAWQFAPACQERVVKKAFVRVSFPLIEDCSIPYDFSHPCLAEMPGARVRVYFNPFAGARVQATLALAQPYGRRRSGEILGVAPQTNATTDYLRGLVGLGQGADTIGKQMKQRAYAQVRREVRSILGGGRIGPVAVEKRDGLGNALQAQLDAPASPPRAVQMSYRERAYGD